jgi:hypothetical protein
VKGNVFDGLHQSVLATKKVFQGAAQASLLHGDWIALAEPIDINGGHGSKRPQDSKPTVFTLPPTSRQRWVNGPG